MMRKYKEVPEWWVRNSLPPSLLLLSLFHPSPWPIPLMYHVCVLLTLRSVDSTLSSFSSVS
jgi:hypothetical protein